MPIDPLILQPRNSQPPITTQMARFQHQSVFEMLEEKYELINPLLLTPPDPRCQCATCRNALNNA